MPEYHALASPSGAHRYLNCANSLAMEKGQPDSSSGAADLGTDKHELMSLCLEFKKNAIDYLGHTLGKGHKVDKSFAADVQAVLDNVRERILGYELRGCTGTVEIEQDVPIDQITGEEGATGRADIVLIVSWPDGTASIDVIDAKFGYQEVDAEWNPQLMMYGHGALEKFGLVEDFTEVNLVIEQPLRTGNEWSTTPDELNKWVNEVAQPEAHKAIQIYNSGALLLPENFAPGEKTCMWCKASAVCKAKEDWLAAKTEIGFEVGEVPNVDTLTIEQLGARFEFLEAIEDHMKAIRARIELEVFAGRKVPGVKVVAGKRGNRQWSSEEEAEAMMKAFRLKTEQMYSFKLLGPKPILEALKDQPRRVKKIEQLIVQGEGKPHVVLDTDKRPAIEIKPIEDGFETVDEEDLC